MRTELRDSDQARQYLTQGVWLQRLSVTSSDTIAGPLQCAMSLAAADEVIPPVGFVADVLRLVFSAGEHHDRNEAGNRGWPPETLRAYEDYVLGKLYGDIGFERASVAICRYEKKLQNEAVAWLIARICDRLQFDGVVLSPAVARSLQGVPPEDVVSEGSESLTNEGVMPLLSDSYEQLTTGFRNVGEVLSPEDVFELEKETALVEFGQRLALRQVIRCAEEYSQTLPGKAPRPGTRQYNVPTHIMEEDTYPIGGFTSISTKGSIESLLHSELAYMETDEAHRPDLFELKFVRSELLYYSRDENEFLRRRRTFQFLLYPDLTECRVKDEGQPFQRFIQILALKVTLVNKLLEWLSDDAVSFQFCFVTDSSTNRLSDEQALLQMIFSEQMSTEVVQIQSLPIAEFVQMAEEHARTSTTHCLVFSTNPRQLPYHQAMPTYFNVAKRQPVVTFPGTSEGQSFETFEEALLELVRDLIV